MKKIPENSLSRGEFFGVARIFFIALLAACSPQSSAIEEFSTGEIATPSPEPLDVQTLMREIAQFRGVFKLTPVPQELSEEFVQAALVYKSEKREFEDKLPDFMRSYGDRIRQLLPITFGERAQELVHGVTLNRDPNAFASFDPALREVRLSMSAYEKTPVGEISFGDNYFHEVAGHGSDPVLAKGLYPFEVLTRLSHAKWQILSQSLSVEKNFLNHPKDDMLPTIQADLGIEIAKRFVFESSEHNLTNQVANGANFISEFMVNWAKERGEELDEMPYTRHLCAALGAMCWNRILDGSIVLSGELKKFYTNEVEVGLREIYAEMIRYAVFHPDDIGRNKTIMDGVAEIFSTLRGNKVDLTVLKNEVMNVPPEILAKFEIEKAFMEREALQVDTTSMENQLDQLVEEQDKFVLFTQKALLPPEFGALPPELFALMQRYANTVRVVYTEYPEIVNATNPWDLSFDPYINAWDTLAVANAANPAYIQYYIAHPEEIGKYVETINNSCELLEWFVNDSGAFGTNVGQ